MYIQLRARWHKTSKKKIALQYYEGKRKQLYHLIMDKKFVLQPTYNKEDRWGKLLK